jgi:hypothetical protein
MVPFAFDAGGSAGIVIMGRVVVATSRRYAE